MFRGLLRFFFGPSKTERVQQEVELRRYSYREGLHTVQPEQYAAASREVGEKVEPQERRPPDAIAQDRPVSRSEALERAQAVYDRFFELERQRADARQEARQRGFEIANENESRSLELGKLRETLREQVRQPRFEISNDNGSRSLELEKRLEAFREKVKQRRFEIANDNDMGRER